MEAQVKAAWWVLVAVAAIGVAQQIGVWSDTAGNMKLSNLASWRVTRESPTKMTFRGQGNPFSGEWKEQRLKVRAQSVVGAAVKDEKGAYHLASAVIEGNVVAAITETVKSGERITELRATSIDYNADQAVANLKGGVRIVSRTPAESQTLELKGNAASVKLPPIGTRSDWPIRSAEVVGGVTMRLDSIERGEEPAKPRPVVVTGKADRIAFDDSARTITLSGNVELEGSDTIIGANVRALKAVIRLDDKREVADIELTGNPGRSELRDHGGRP